MGIEQKWIRVQAYKHDGSLHRMWSHSYLIEETEEFYVLASVRSKVSEFDGRLWHTREPAIFYLSKHKWFNVIAMLKETGVTYYVNIASPTIMDSHILKYVDYDLDIKLFPSGNKRLLDINEYKSHSESLHYEDSIKNKLDEAVSELYTMMDNKEYPFDEEIVKTDYARFEKETKCEKPIRKDSKLFAN